MTHETEASALAEAYIGGDEQERRRIAEACEERGILAALVTGRLRPEGLEDECIGAMKGSADTGRGR